MKSNKSKIALICFYIIVFIGLAIALPIYLNKTIDFNEEKIVTYNEQSNIDYRVYLNKNDFYTEEYLTKDMLYVANLINNISLDFNYLYKSDLKQDLNFEYEVIGKLVITNKSGTKSYFEKEYKLVEKKKVSMIEQDMQAINEIVKVDYNNFNTIANSFKNQYGVDAESKLDVYMKINTINEEKVVNTSNLNVSIPLTQKSVDIKLDYKNINETKKMIDKKPLTKDDITNLSIAGVVFVAQIIIFILIIVDLFKLGDKKSKYDIYISKLLKEYDRLIVESSSMVSFEGKEIVRIKKFSELLDIHDNLQLPIIFYELIPHKKAFMYVNNNNTVMYLHEIDENVKFQ